jgi:HAD-superfamily hydrolase, subfamily IIB
MKNKLVFFDIDGTLIDSLKGINAIPSSTIKSLKSLNKKGHRSFIATGRCESFIVDSVLAYPFDGFVTCNGGYVSYQGECIIKHPIPLKAMEVAIEFARINNTILYLESSEKIYVVNGHKLEHLDFERIWQMKHSIQVHDFNVENIETYIGMMLMNDESEFPLLYQTLSPYFDVQRHPNQLSFDLTLKNVSKAVGIKSLVDKLGYNLEDVFAFGDGNNDLEMIELVGCGIAMGNAVETLKNIANYITTDIDNAGIEKALIKYGLI